MSRLGTLASALVLTFVMTSVPGAAETRDWPDWAGPEGNRSSTGNGVFEGDLFGLQQNWLTQLGSGYSGITVVGQTAITGMADEEYDYLVALDTNTGAEKWRYRIAEVYKGHDGSDDGPLATPAVHGGKVFGMGARGELFAVDLETGKQLWKVDIHQDLEAQEPVYGFTASPIVVEEVLVVLTGADPGRAVSGFKPDNGELLWSAADGKVAYQSPLGMKIDGRSMVVAATDKALLGIDPKSGETLFSHQISEEGIEEAYAHPVPIGTDRVFLNLRDDSGVFRIAENDDGYSVEEVWRNNAFINNYSIPVYWQGHLYGYSGSILKCVDAETGENVWRSRPPGMGYLILVDGHLTIQTNSGDLVIAEASPEGYEEKTRVEALANGYYTHPSFADGKIFTRNLSQIASLSVTETAVEPAPMPAAIEAELLGEFGEWVRQVEQAEDKQAMVAELMAEHDSFPIVEGDRLVHFVYKGDVEDIALTGAVVQGPDLALNRIEGTDLYYRSMNLEPASIYTYRMTIWDEGMADPLNPKKAGPEGNELSIITTGGFEEPTHLDEAERQGTVEEYTWKSEMLDNERTVNFYLPPGYADSEDRYPVLVVNHGNQALALASMNNTLDNLIAEGRIEPVVAAFVPRMVWAEYGGSHPDRYAKAVAEELLPYMDETYRTDRDKSTTGIMGVGSAGFAAIYAAFSEPETFGMAASQSFYWCEKEDNLIASIESAEADGRRFYIERSKRDYYNEPSGLDARAASEKLAGLLEERGFEVETNLTGNVPDWIGWAVTADSILESMYATD